MSDKDQEIESTISIENELDQLREGVDDPMVLKEQLRKEAEARRQLTARAKKGEADAKAEREARIKLEEALSEKEKITNNNSPVTEDERLELRLDGYSKDEVNYIMQNGGKKVLEDPNSYTAIAIKTRREQLKAELAASQTEGGKGEDQFKPTNFTLPKNPSRKDLNKSIEEMEKILPHAD